MKIYHVYVDWTTREATSRPFYVGKGRDQRIKIVARNKNHSEILNVLGFRREIVCSSSDHDFILDFECKMIAYHHTFMNDPQWNEIGCNLTPGGEGVAQHTVETCEKIKQGWTDERREKARQRMLTLNPMKDKETAKRVTKKLAKFWTNREWSEERKKRASEAKKGDKNPNFGRPLSEDVKRKLSDSVKKSKSKHRK